MIRYKGNVPVAGTNYKKRTSQRMSPPKRKTHSTTSTTSPLRIFGKRNGIIMGGAKRFGDTTRIRSLVPSQLPSLSGSYGYQIHRKHLKPSFMQSERTIKTAIWLQRFWRRRQERLKWLSLINSLVLLKKTHSLKNSLSAGRARLKWARLKITQESLKTMDKAKKEAEDISFFENLQQGAIELAKREGTDGVWAGKLKDEAVATRFAILKNSKFRSKSRLFFDVACGLNKGDDKIDKYEYMVMMSKVSKSLQPDFNAKECKRVLNSDWKEDCKGKRLLKFADFNRSLFELVDVWCECVNLENYCWFLEHLFSMVAEPIPIGETATTGGLRDGDASGGIQSNKGSDGSILYRWKPDCEIGDGNLRDFNFEHLRSKDQTKAERRYKIRRRHEWNQNEFLKDAPWIARLGSTQQVFLPPQKLRPRVVFAKGPGEAEVAETLEENHRKIAADLAKHREIDTNNNLKKLHERKEKIRQALAKFSSIRNSNVKSTKIEPIVTDARVSEYGGIKKQERDFRAKENPTQVFRPKPVRVLNSPKSTYKVCTKPYKSTESLEARKIARNSLNLDSNYAKVKGVSVRVQSQQRNGFSGKMFGKNSGANHRGIAALGNYQDDRMCAEVTTGITKGTVPFVSRSMSRYTDLNVSRSTDLSDNLNNISVDLKNEHGKPNIIYASYILDNDFGNAGLSHLQRYNEVDVYIDEKNTQSFLKKKKSPLAASIVKCTDTARKNKKVANKNLCGLSTFKISVDVKHQKDLKKRPQVKGGNRQRKKELETVLPLFADSMGLHRRLKRAATTT